MVVGLNDFGIQAFAATNKYSDDYIEHFLLSLGGDTLEHSGFTEEAPMALLAYGIPPREHAKFQKPKNDPSSRTDGSVRGLTDLLASRGRLQDAKDLADIWSGPCWLSPEYTAKRLPCPLPPAEIQVFTGDGHGALDLGTPRRMTSAMWSAAVSGGTSAALLYYVHGYCQRLGVELEGPVVAKLLSKGVSWWKSGALNNLYDVIPPERCANSYRALMLTGRRYTVEERATGLSAFCALASSSQEELAPYVLELPAESILKVRSKALLDVMMILPWDSVRDAVADPRVQAHLLAFLARGVNYKWLFTDNPKRAKRPRLPTSEELEAREVLWTNAAERLLATGDAACRLRDKARELGGGPYGAFVLWAAHNNPTIRAAIRDPAVLSAAEQLHAEATEHDLLYANDAPRYSKSEARRAATWFVDAEIPRYFHP